MSSSLKAMIHNRCYDRRVRPSRQFKASKGGQVIGDTQARWSSDEPNSYARVFGYDEEGRLVKISGITVLVACSWRMSTGTVVMVRVCGSGMCGTGRSIGISVGQVALQS